MATPDELAPGVAVTAPPADAPVRAWPTVQEGDTGPAVLMLQYLVALDRVSGAGRFGPRTALAVRAYQASRGLTADGVVGLATWTALLTQQPPLLAGAPRPQKAIGQAEPA
jgi:peptidoglycan hydrolase-like protein with peptidoglycan-binding domain